MNTLLTFAWWHSKCLIKIVETMKKYKNLTRSIKMKCIICISHESSNFNRNFINVTLFLTISVIYNKTLILF